jgi:hypothetical protein
MMSRNPFSKKSHSIKKSAIPEFGDSSVKGQTILLHRKCSKMKKQSIAIVGLVAALAFGFILSGCDKDESETKSVVFSASGDINAKLTEFRNQLGPVNNTLGKTSGRREINWDGVPDSLNGKKLPANFFNPTEVGAPESLQRGAVYASSDIAMVSAGKFSEVNSQASTEFASFSGNKSFSVVNATLWPVSFKVAGTNTDASVSAFGAVFSDVDKANTTFIEFFENNISVGRFYVPPHDNTSSFSFLGVYFPKARISDVVIGHEGKLSDGEKDITQGGTKDLVVLDDFIYSEPVNR